MYLLKHSRIIYEENLIVVKPERTSLITAFSQFIIALLFFWILTQFSNSLNFFFLSVVFFLLLIFGGLSILGLIYSIW